MKASDIFMVSKTVNSIHKGKGRKYHHCIPIRRDIFPVLLFIVELAPYFSIFSLVLLYALFLHQISKLNPLRNCLNQLKAHDFPLQRPADPQPTKVEGFPLSHFLNAHLLGLQSNVFYWTKAMLITQNMSHCSG